MARLGTTTVEVKSGYGLSTEAELKMLDAIRRAGDTMQSTVVGTFLGAHAIDRDTPDFVRKTINTTLPAVVEAHPGITCDAYCEEGAWSLEDCRTLFEEAQSDGLPDQSACGSIPQSRGDALRGVRPAHEASITWKRRPMRNSEFSRTRTPWASCCRAVATTSMIDTPRAER